MSTYDLVELGLAVAVFVLGLIMVICPKACTKKEQREDAEAVAKVRKSGILEMVVGVLLLVLFLI